VLEELVDASALVGADDAREIVPHVVAQALLWRVPLARQHRFRVHLVRELQSERQHFLVQPRLVAKVVAHCGEVRHRRRGDVAHGHLAEAALGKESHRGLENAPPRFRPVRRCGRHSVRRKSFVASVMAMSEKIAR
jgi:hypothetical protein